MAQRVVNFRGGEQIVVPFPLDKIATSHNVRRPCRKLQRQGIVPLEFMQRYALSDNPEDNRHFVATMAQEDRIVSLALSIEEKGQIQPAVLRVFRSKMKDGDGYEQKAGYIAGERRGLAQAFLESLRRIAVAEGKQPGDTVKVGEFEYVIPAEASLSKPHALDAICLDKITVEEAHEIALDENDERDDMTPLDWGVEFDRLLRTVNPATNKLYTIREVAEKRCKRRGKSDSARYHYVRTRAALPYLPDDWKARLEDGELNLVEACNHALQCKQAAFAANKGEEPVPEIGEEAPTVPVLSTATAPVPAGDLAAAVKSRKRNNPLSRAEIEALIDGTDRSNTERIKALAEVLRLKPGKALDESEVRLARQAEKEHKGKKRKGVA